MPHNEEIKIKSIDINGNKAQTAKVGDLCTLAIHLPQGFDSNWLSPGDVLCDKTYKAKFVQQFRATLKVFDIPKPILKGKKVLIHSHFTKVYGKIAKIEGKIDSTTGEVIP